MTTIRKQHLLAALLFALATMQSFAQSGKKITVHLDAAQTQIHWTLGSTLHTVHGTFNFKGGVLSFDPATGAAEGEILVDAASGQSGNKSRDGKMQREVLESAKYPQILFHPTKITGKLKPGAAQVMTVEGTLTIHGQDHPLTLSVQVQMAGNHRVTATTHFSVPYVAWGMKDPSVLVLRVNKQVQVEVVSHGTVDGVQ